MGKTMTEKAEPGLTRTRALAVPSMLAAIRTFLLGNINYETTGLA